MAQTKLLAGVALDIQCFRTKLSLADARNKRVPDAASSLLCSEIASIAALSSPNSTKLHHHLLN